MIKRTVFFVDEDDNYRHLFKESLALVCDNSVVVGARNGAQLLGLLHSGSKHAVIILNINSPKSNGIKTLRALNVTPSLPVYRIIVTSNTQNTDLESAVYGLGAVKFTRKSEDMTELLDLVYEVSTR